MFISNLLSSHGYIPIMAETRAEGFRKVIEEDPAVIIIDMMIPNEGGIQLYRDLKHDPRFHRIPVIMLSTIARKTFFKWHKLPKQVSARYYVIRKENPQPILK